MNIYRIAILPAFILGLIFSVTGCTSIAIKNAGLQDHLFVLRDDQVEDYLNANRVIGHPIAIYTAGLNMVAAYDSPPRVATISLVFPSAPKAQSVPANSEDYYLDQRGDVRLWKDWKGYERFFKSQPDSHPTYYDVDGKSGTVLISTYRGSRGEFWVTTLDSPEHILFHSASSNSAFVPFRICAFDSSIFIFGSGPSSEPGSQEMVWTLSRGPAGSEYIKATETKVPGGLEVADPWSPWVVLRENVDFPAWQRHFLFNLDTGQCINAGYVPGNLYFMNKSVRDYMAGHSR